MSVNIMQDNISDNNCIGLSPPSESLMLQRRKSLQKGHSLQLNRINNNNKVLSIQVSLKQTEKYHFIQNMSFELL